MICAAVYLDHHWVIDVVLGLGYASSIHLLSRVVFGRSATPQHAHSLPAVPA
jgi:membrane-associated phospholipid phosphatase